MLAFKVRGRLALERTHEKWLLHLRVRKEVGMVCMPAILALWEAETGKLLVQIQPQHLKLVRLCLKMKANKQKRWVVA